MRLIHADPRAQLAIGRLAAILLKAQQQRPERGLEDSVAFAVQFQERRDATSSRSRRRRVSRQLQSAGQ
jgi:hypothetical protein